MKRFIVKNGKKLHYGYTTGSCAAAAAKAATKMLFLNKKVDNIKINTPKGWILDLKVEEPFINEKYTCCAIKKDSGDDPDITDGIKIYAKAIKSHTKKITITGGKGIGKITKPGLAVKIGDKAINPVPRNMIKKEVKEVLPTNKGVSIEIFIPKGEEIAKKTFNPKLGIVGGISIIGTSGIVEPMSEDAFKESLALELSILKEKGVKKIIFTPGNYGRDFSKSRNLNKEVVKTSNFIGYMIDKAKEYDIKEILFIGHIGKMVKVAGGIFNTHSKMADGRMEILSAYCALMGASQNLIEKIMKSITTEEATKYIKDFGYEDIFNQIAEKITEKCRERTNDSLKIGSVIFSQEQGYLGSCSYGKKLLEEYKNE
ncbi:MAG: cobalamin biosynthesis protein CbiD [Firmicutes bacterium]|nr:cobalamin biosynthesis protein CbiD [Bacillota bacterium]